MDREKISSYIRSKKTRLKKLPPMEYGNVVWGGTYDSDICKIEQIQVDALRLITGATARSSIAALYKETRFHTILERCQFMQLIMFYKIKNGLAPTYLPTILPQAYNSPYDLRNSGFIHKPPFRLTTFERSFVPTAIDLWNKLPDDICFLPTLASFKSTLMKRETDMYLYYYGERWPSIHHARIRMGCSKLNYDLTFNLKVIQNPSCICGCRTEDADHFFLTCQQYSESRRKLQSLLPQRAKFDSKTLLYGDANLSHDENLVIFSAVHEFILETRRFT